MALYLYVKVIFTILFCVHSILLSVSYTEAHVDYCISKTQENLEISRAKNKDSFNSKTLEIYFDENSYYIEVIRSGIALVDREAHKILSYQHCPQDFRRGIKNVVLSKSGLIYIDGRSTDYFSYLDVSHHAPELKKVMRLPTLCQRPCGYFGRDYTSGVRLSGSRYAYSLDRIFITGNAPNLFGIPWPRTYEISAKSPGEINIKTLNVKFHADIPELGGVLLRGSSEEALFYDGKHIQNLWSKSKTWNKQYRIINWWKYNLTGRQKFSTFLYVQTERNSSSRQTNFLIEIGRDSIFNIIELPSNLKAGSMAVFQLSKDQLIFFSKHEIYLHMKNQFQLLAKVSNPFYMKAISNVSKNANGFRFKVFRGSEDYSAVFDLQEKKSDTKCLFDASIDHPTSLVF